MAASAAGHPSTAVIQRLRRSCSALLKLPPQPSSAHRRCLSSPGPAPDSGVVSGCSYTGLCGWQSCSRGGGAHDSCGRSSRASTPPTGLRPVCLPHRRRWTCLPRSRRRRTTRWWAGRTWCARRTWAPARPRRRRASRWRSPTRSSARCGRVCRGNPGPLTLNPKPYTLDTIPQL